MDAPTVPRSRAKRAIRVELDPDCLARVAEAAEDRQTTASLLIAKEITERYPPPPTVP